MSDAQRQERCQNNKNRIAELETQLKIIDAELSNTMTKREMEDTRTQMTFVRQLKHLGYYSTDDMNKLDRISVQYNLNQRDCFEQNLGKAKTGASSFCLTELEKIISAKIDKATALQNKRPDLVNKKNEINKQIATHRSNLIAFGCNNTVSSNWSGVYTNGNVLVTLSGNAASGTYKNDGFTNTFQWSLNRVFPIIL